MKFKNLSILQKIGLVVAMMTLSSVVIAAIGARGIVSLENAIVTVGAKEEVAREAMDLRVDVIAISRMTYQLALKPGMAADFRTEADKRSGEMLARLPKIEATADATQLTLLKTIRTALDGYFAEIRTMVDHAAAKPTDAAGLRTQLDQVLETQKAVTVAIKEYSAYSGTALASARADALAASHMALLVGLGIAGACILLGAVVGLMAARRGIAVPVRDLTGAMSRLAEGDLDTTGIDAARKDEIGEMARAVEVFRRNALAMRDMKAQEQALHALSSDLQASISTVVDDASETSSPG